MQIIKQEAISALEQSKSTLAAGGIIVYPTETVYGLGCDPSNRAAVERLYKLKNIPPDKPCLLVVASIEMAEEYGVFNDLARGLVSKYWPGPLTMVVPVKSDCGLVSNLINRTDQTVGLRWPAYKFAQDLSQAFGRPIVSTSANLSGKATAFSLAEVELQFKGSVDQTDLMIDGGILPDVKPSTVVQVIDEKVEVLRQGEITIQT